MSIIRHTLAVPVSLVVLRLLNWLAFACQWQDAPAAEQVAIHLSTAAYIANDECREYRGIV